MTGTIEGRKRDWTFISWVYKTHLLRDSFTTSDRHKNQKYRLYKDSEYDVRFLMNVPWQGAKLTLA